MKLLTILLCSLIILQISAQGFDAILALSWPAGHCEYLQGLKRKCDTQLLAPWNRRSFTIHGYWTQRKSNANQDFGNFNLEAVKPVIKQINTYWPPRSEASRNPKNPTFQEKYFLWIHEWQKHGADFASAYIALTGGKGLSTKIQARNIQIQKIFFAETLKLYKRFAGAALNTQPKTKTDLATALKVQPFSLITRCLTSGNIQEIRICTKLQIHPKTGEFLITETGCRSGNNCPTPEIKLKDFR